MWVESRVICIFGELVLFGMWLKLVMILLVCFVVRDMGIFFLKVNVKFV